MGPCDRVTMYVFHAHLGSMLGAREGLGGPAHLSPDYAVRDEGVADDATSNSGEARVLGLPRGQARVPGGGSALPTVVLCAWKSRERSKACDGSVLERHSG